LVVHGPDVSVECKVFDADDDSDVDLLDFAVLEEGYTGPD